MQIYVCLIRNVTKTLDHYRYHKKSNTEKNYTKKKEYHYETSRLLWIKIRGLHDIATPETIRRRWEKEMLVMWDDVGNGFFLRDDICFQCGKEHYN